MYHTKEQNSKKRLLLIVPTLHQGGYEKACVETAHIMADVCHVTVLIFDGRNRHYEIGDVPVIDIDLPARPGTFAKAWNLLRRRRAIRKIKSENKIDITYSFGMTANLANVMSKSGDKIVTSLHSAMDFDTPEKLRRVVRGSDLIVSCAERLKERAEQEYDAKDVRLLYNPHDAERICRLAKDPAGDLPFAGASPLLVTMGRDDDVKGYWHLIKAFSVLKRTEPYAKLMVIGCGTFTRERELIQALGLSEDVIFTGTRQNPFPYLAAADIFVLTSNREGFPNALVEAMALGLPLIATDCETGPREILLSEDIRKEINTRYPDGASVKDIIEGDTGMLIPGMDSAPDYDAAHITPEDRMLENALKRMWADREKMSAWGERGRKRAAAFSPEQYKKTCAECLGI